MLFSWHVWVQRYPKRDLQRRYNLGFSHLRREEVRGVQKIFILNYIYIAHGSFNAMYVPVPYSYVFSLRNDQSRGQIIMTFLNEAYFGWVANSPVQGNGRGRSDATRSRRPTQQDPSQVQVQGSLFLHMFIPTLFWPLAKNDAKFHILNDIGFRISSP